MNAVCHDCGSPKSSPAVPCSNCYRTPFTEEELIQAHVLSTRFLTPDRLEEASRFIGNGGKVSIPDHLLAAARMPMIQDHFVASSKREKGKFPALAFAAGLLILAVFLIYLFAASGPRYQWAKFWGTVESYEAFIKRFPDSRLADSAKDRLRLLREEEVWAAAAGAEEITLLRDYVSTYPDGRHLPEAAEKIQTIADQEWDAISETASEQTIRAFLKDYPETTRVASARTRIQKFAEQEWSAIARGRSVEKIRKFPQDNPDTSRKAEAEILIEQLRKDYIRVRQQNTVEAYRHFLAEFPDHPGREWIEKRIIDLEVSKIAAGKHGKLPEAVPLTRGGSITKVTVENKTGYELTVRYSGPDSKKLVVPVAQTRTLTLAPGTYQVAASVNVANVENYYGNSSMPGGTYSSSYFITTTRRGNTYPTRRFEMTLPGEK